MIGFPVFLRLEGRRCLVVGGGALGRRRARAVAEAGALVEIVEPIPSPELVDLCAELPSLNLLQRTFRDGDCDGALLVFACCDRPDVQAAVDADAARGSALLCRGDDADAGDFWSAALLRRRDLCVAVSSGAASPVLGRRVRDLIAGLIGEEYGEAGQRLALLRSRLRRSYASPSQRAAVVERLLDAGWIALLGAGEGARAEALLLSVLGEAAAAPIPPEVDPCTR